MASELPEGFQLPEGYSFDPPPGVDQQVLIDGQKLYGGADPSDAYDAQNAHWVFCNATGPDKLFRFRAFWKEAASAVYVERALPDSVDGRGNADVQWSDGRAHYMAWQGAQFYPGIVPGFAAFPSIPSLQAQINQLKLGVVGAPGAGIHPVAIPPDGAISALWHGNYTAEQFDTPEETALRVLKLLKGVNEIVAKLIEAGVFV